MTRLSFSPRLSPNIDVAAVRSEFAARGRARVRDFLDADAAEELHRCLRERVPWKLAYSENSVNVLADATNDPGAAPPDDLVQKIHALARTGFQYLYRSYPMVTAYLSGANPELPLNATLEWLNAPETLSFIRDVTGISTIRKGDAQATLYGPGNFLTLHDDTGAPKELRRVAYVLNLTRRWQADWGGLLQFVDAAGEITDTWLPTFNTMALFRVPVRHTVSYVAPFANEPRLAITGWFRDT